ncbi:hypothetical protein SKAU_G00111090 [Synaphobranchus kaupii]|uniref:Uncharacterized protein n=1 Tax=Synaphobranchus kaupii TaxID=118154 RepID=A0A9Q1G0I9_SYNKA|nr:hypothetical protein SKAU_G00111090 [Synaphobranchus kaupii]
MRFDALCTARSQPHCAAFGTTDAPLQRPPLRPTRSAGNRSLSPARGGKIMGSSSAPLFSASRGAVAQVPVRLLTRGTDGSVQNLLQPFSASRQSSALPDTFIREE